MGHPLADEIVCPLPHEGRIQETTHFRSTWLSGSLRALRERNLMDAYLARLPKESHEPILQAVAGVWLPVQVACDHYEACDKLDLSHQDLIELGRAASSYAQGSVLMTVTKLARSAGVTPWTVFGQLGRFWERVWRGGGVAVFKLGPKEARAEIHGWPCARYGYTRYAMRGVFLSLTERYCERGYVHEIPALCTPRSLGYRISWA